MKKDTNFILKIFATYKIFIICVAFAATAVIPAAIINTEKVADNILNPFAQYDTTAYFYIAKNGYTDDFYGAYHLPNYHWYPLYPLLIRSLGFLGYDVAAFLISNVASFFVVLLLYKLTSEISTKHAKKTTFYFLFFPTAYYLTVMYTEPLFLALVLASFYYARKNNWMLAGATGFFAALTRAQGLLLFIPILYLYIRYRKIDIRKPEIKKINIKVLYTLLIPLGTFVFAAYQYFALGDFFAQFKSLELQGVGRGGFPWDGYIHAINAVFADTTLINVSYHILNIFLMTSFIFLAYVSWKKLDKSYTIYFILNLLLLLFAKNFYGAPRYLFVIFPAFMALPFLETSRRRKYVLTALYIVFIFLAIGMISLHVTERFSSPILYTPLF